MFGQRRRFAPVKEGDELDVKIEAVGEKGDGIAKKQGFVLFVPNTKEGDEVRVRVTRVLRNAGFAEVIGSSTGKAPEAKPAQPKEEEEVAELEEESKEHDSEDFGEETAEEPEAEEVAEKPDEEFEESAEEEPAKEEADDSEFKDE
jgi:predicted RNA-binding protein with TRAM domain